MTRLATPNPTRRPVAPAAPTPPPSIDAIGAELEALLEGLLGEQRGLLEINARHLEAVSMADRLQIDRCAAAQQQASQRLGLLESKRLTLVRRATLTLRAIDPRRVGDVTTTVIAGACGEPRGSRLLALAGQVRAIAEKTSSQTRTLKLAAQTLTAHMQGLMEQVGRALSHTGTYARPAGATYVPQVVSTLDLTS